MVAINVWITGFLITQGYIYKHYPLVGFYHVISHLREGRNMEEKKKREMSSIFLRRWRGGLLSIL